MHVKYNRNITEVEKPAAEKAGEGTRTDHGGRVYHTENSTSTKETKDANWPEE